MVDMHVAEIGVSTACVSGPGQGQPHLASTVYQCILEAPPSTAKADVTLRYPTKWVGAEVLETSESFHAVTKSQRLWHCDA